MTSIADEDLNGLNRTKVGLKFMKTRTAKFGLYGLNRTKVGLKCYQEDDIWDCMQV